MFATYHERQLLQLSCHLLHTTDSDCNNHQQTCHTRKTTRYCEHLAQVGTGCGFQSQRLRSGSFTFGLGWMRMRSLLTSRYSTWMRHQLSMRFRTPGEQNRQKMLSRSTTCPSPSDLIAIMHCGRLVSIFLALAYGSMRFVSIRVT